MNAGAKECRSAVHPQRPTQSRSAVHPSETQGDRAALRREFRELVQTYEPERMHQMAELLRVYAGMEHELLQCYRHLYTGNGGFRISSPASEATRESSSTESPVAPPASATTFSLPKAAIATYLREKLRLHSRRPTSNSSLFSSHTSSSHFVGSCSKGDDMRSPEMPLSSTRAQPAHQQPQRVVLARVGRC